MRDYHDDSIAKPPSDNEAETLHTLLQSSDNEDAVPMNETIHTSYCIIQPQNIHKGDIVAGGIIMREAFELAWLTGFLYNDSQQIKTIGMDKAHFSYSPKLGDALRLQSKILFS